MLSSGFQAADWTYDENEEFSEDEDDDGTDDNDTTDDDDKGMEDDDGNHDEERDGVSGFPFAHLHDIQTYISELEGATRKTRLEGVQCKKGPFPASRQAHAREELDGNCQLVRQELFGLLDRDRFPQMQGRCPDLKPIPRLSQPRR